MATHEHVFWQETVNMPATAGEPPGGQVDVAVIGGGITGLSAARTLAQQGATVALLEAQSVGQGASSRNGGMVLTGLRLGVDVLLARYGRERAHRMFNASLAAIDFMAHLIDEAQINCDFARCGHLELACKPSHYRHFAQIADLSAKAFNHPLRLVEKEGLPSEIGATCYHGGLVDEWSAGVNPARYVAGLARAAQQAGAVLYDHAPVQQIAQAGATFRVVTKRGELCAKQIFVATGGYTGRATPALQRKVFPVGSYIIVTEPLPPALAQELSPHNRMMFDAKNFLSYFRLTPDQRLLFGGRAAFYPETPARVRASADITRRGLVAVFPQLRNVAIDYVWLSGALPCQAYFYPHLPRPEKIVDKIFREAGSFPEDASVGRPFVILVGKGKPAWGGDWNGSSSYPLPISLDVPGVRGTDQGKGGKSESSGSVPGGRGARDLTPVQKEGGKGQQAGEGWVEVEFTQHNFLDKTLGSSEQRLSPHIQT